MSSSDPGMTLIVTGFVILAPLHGVAVHTHRHVGDLDAGCMSSTFGVVGKLRYGDARRICSRMRLGLWHLPKPVCPAFPLAG